MQQPERRLENLLGIVVAGDTGGMPSDGVYVEPRAGVGGNGRPGTAANEEWGVQQAPPYASGNLLEGGRAL
jgi:hypothetical protein